MECANCKHWKPPLDARCLGFCRLHKEGCHRTDGCKTQEGRKASWRDVVAAIKAERERQGLRWGSKHDSCHSLMDWLSILAREVEEAIAEAHEDGALTELLRVAAVAMAALEWCGVPEEQLEEG